MTDQAKEKETRESILRAAREVFVEKGLNGARMQEIANRAGINKALLHYYFNNKETLFDFVFKEAFSQFWPRINEELLRDVPFRSVVKAVVHGYMTMLRERPYLPNFILNELHTNPDRLERLMKEAGFHPEVLIAKIQQEIEHGTCRAFDPREIIINVISLSMFPFAARPLVQRVWFGNDPEQYEQFINRRAETLVQFLDSALFFNARQNPEGF